MLEVKWFQIKSNARKKCELKNFKKGCEFNEKGVNSENIFSFLAFQKTLHMQDYLWKTSAWLSWRRREPFDDWHVSVVVLQKDERGLKWKMREHASAFEVRLHTRGGARYTPVLHSLCCIRKFRFLSCYLWVCHYRLRVASELSQHSYAWKGPTKLCRSSDVVWFVEIFDSTCTKDYNFALD